MNTFQIWRRSFGMTANLSRVATSELRRLSSNSRDISGYHTKRSKHGLPDGSDDGHGDYSRTDKAIHFEYPPDEDLPASSPLPRTGGTHMSRTLASFSLEGKVGVVTGGARGIGSIMAQALVVSGADVALVDLDLAECKIQAGKLIDAFKAENPGARNIPKVTAHFADVSDPQSVQSSVNAILKAHGRIDHLITAAGFVENFNAVEYPSDRMKRLFAVNFDGTYYFATAVARHLLERRAKGSMVMIGSISSVVVMVPQPQAPYNASKAAVRQLCASLAVEWADAGIRVNCINPGYFRTALTQKIMDENPTMYRKWVALIPNGQFGASEDLMGAAVYLLSDAANYVTGTELRIDGGYTLT
ncbi:MAG: hypothetical protein MMC23_006833 [Stictis urceolatum]|nr:hypothetical protein [Stictis urceolata]